MIPIAYACSRPFWERLTDATSDPAALFDWVFCPYSIEVGLPVVGTMLMVIGFVGLFNWSESWTLPLTWMALVAPIVAVTALPGGLIRIIGGIITFGVMGLFIGIYYWWGRT